MRCMTFHADPPADTNTPIWEHGWLRHAHQLASPNFGPRPVGVAVDLAVIHSISLPPGEYGTGCVQQLFTNTLDWNAHPYFQQIAGIEVSAHFFIERSGRLWQFVSCDERAWHAGKSEFEGRANCNDYSIGIELEGLEGHRFEPPQYWTLTWLCRALAAHYPITKLVGHEHIAPDRKKDPGPGFDWAQLTQPLAHLRTPFHAP